MTDTPFLLKPREVAKKARAAYKAGDLGFQRGHEDCLYDYGDGSNCAIGVALPKRVLAQISSRQNGEEIRPLVVQRIFRTESELDLRLLELLQDSHDRLCEAGPQESETFRRCKRRFLRWLRACEAA